MTEFEIKHGLSQDHPGPLEPVEVAASPVSTVEQGDARAAIKLVHLAVAEDGGVRFMTGRTLPDGIESCELYAMPDYGRAPAELFTAPAAGDAPSTVSLVTRQGPGQQLFTYTAQPCDNVIAWRIGEACSKASQASAGDYIDRGLSLLKELQRKGYGIADISATQRQGDA